MNEKNNLQSNEPFQGSKNVWIIITSIVITSLVVGSGVYFWHNKALKKIEQNLQKKIISSQKQINELQTEKKITERENKNLQKLTQNPENSSTANWVLFDSQKDVGIKVRFKFKHPWDWFQVGSIDGGAASYIPFYEKDTFPEIWEEVKQGVKKHPKEGSPVANILVSGPSMIFPAEIKYNDELKKNITVDGYQGTKFIGINSKTGMKEIKIVLRDCCFLTN